MTKVTRDQFEFLEDVQVRHIPTGATFSTHNFEDPKETVSESIKLGRAGEVLEDGSDYDLGELQATADALLRERAISNSKRSA